MSTRRNIMERYKSRMKHLRSHHKKCEQQYQHQLTGQVQESIKKESVKPIQLGLEKSDNLGKEEADNSSESELSSNSGSGSEYRPNTAELASSDLEGVSGEDSPKDSATSTSGDEKEQRDKCTFKERNSITYTKRKKHQKKKVQIGVTVKTCTKREDKKRVWDKSHYCLYCGKSNLKISRHLQRKHIDINDVAYAFSFQVGSKERKALLEELRNKGDFKHNIEVLKKGRGEIVTWKQPSGEASVQDYLPCPSCFAMFTKNKLWQHKSACRSKRSHETVGIEKSKKRVQSVAARLLPIVESSDGCQNIINNMRQDSVSFHIRSDSLICSYGDSLYAKHGRIKARHQYIAQRMRELGRFVLVAKDMDKTVKGLDDVCTPSKFKLVIQVVKKLTEFSPGKNEYGKPSTAVKIGFCLKGATEVLIGQTLMMDDELAEKKAKKFIELLQRNWKNQVSVSAHQTIQEKRWNAKDDIPLTKNVMALRDYLRMVEDEAKMKLKLRLSVTTYRKLNETVLAQIIVFNRRREGEASRLTLEAYQKTDTGPINEDIFETLSPLEKELSKLVTRIEVRGKRGRKVPIFLTDRMKESVELLIEKREEVGILAENPYLFARPGVMTNIRGCDCLRKLAKESKVEHPDLLRSTKLRKQVATLCQLLDLDEQELEQVARFMGHDIRVHRDIYRQTDKTFQVAKISKLLFAMEQDVGKLKGKNLSTLDPAVSGVSICSPERTQDNSSEDPRADLYDESCGESPKIVSRAKKRKGRKATEKDESSGESPKIVSRAKKRKGKEATEKDESSGESPKIVSRAKKRKGKEATEKDESSGESPKIVSRAKKRKGKEATEKDESSGESPKIVSRAKKRKGKEATEKDIAFAEEAKVIKRPWSEKEKTAVNKHLVKCVEQRRVPGKQECMRCVEKEEALSHRSWKDVKFFVHNTIVTLNRRAAARKLFL